MSSLPDFPITYSFATTLIAAASSVGCGTTWQADGQDTTGTFDVP